MDSRRVPVSWDRVGLGRGVRGRVVVLGVLRDDVSPIGLESAICQPNVRTSLDFCDSELTILDADLPRWLGGNVRKHTIVLGPAADSAAWPP